MLLILTNCRQVKSLRFDLRQTVNTRKFTIKLAIKLDLRMFMKRSKTYDLTYDRRTI